MKKLSFSALLFLTIFLAKEASDTPAKKCKHYEIPLTVTSTNLIFGPRFANNYDMTDYFQHLTSGTVTIDFHPFTDVDNQTATYTISGTFCTPRNESSVHKKIFLIATHGINSDRRY
jgi:hypothetical protein